MAEPKPAKRRPKGSNFWLDLINAALRDVLPERVQLKILPAKAKRSKGSKVNVRPERGG